MFLILATIIVFNLKPTREFHLFSKTEVLWEPNQDHNSENWLIIWLNSATFDRKPTLHEVWEEEVGYFKQNFTTSNQSNLMIKWLKRTFPEAPYMIYIANCESTGLVHRTKTGGLLPNASGSSDRGVLQIHMITHGTEIRKRGLNIEKNQDYFTFARTLFDQSGINPWNSSRHCWEEHYQRIISRI